MAHGYFCICHKDFRGKNCEGKKAEEAGMGLICVVLVRLQKRFVVGLILLIICITVSLTLLHSTVFYTEYLKQTLFAMFAVFIYKNKLFSPFPSTPVAELCNVPRGFVKFQSAAHFTASIVGNLAGNIPICRLCICLFTEIQLVEFFDLQIKITVLHLPARTVPLVLKCQARINVSAHRDSWDHFVKVRIMNSGIYRNFVRDHTASPT